MKTVLFYASVKDTNDFKYKFYKYAIETLQQSNYIVVTTNKIFDFLKFWKYDFSYIYFYKKGVFPALISRIFFKKVLFAGGCDDLHEISNRNKLSRLKFKIFAFFSILFSNNCNVENTTDLEELNRIAYFEKLKKKIFLHPLAIELPLIGEVNKNKKQYLTICWMKTKENAVRKGLLKALQIFEELYKQDNEIQFNIIGDGVEVIEWLKNDIINEYTSKGNIHFWGLVDESVRNNLLKDSMFYFQLSDFEGLGVAAIEATMFKCIVIHTNVGGLKDYMPNYSIIYTDIEKVKLNIELAIKNYDNIANQITQSLFLLQKDFSHINRSAVLKNVYE